MHPYRVIGPAMVSFSGGRTSARMLRGILDAGLEPDVHVLFANTGKEREETLVFVHEVATRWNVIVHWVERPEEGGMREVDFYTAARAGEPFKALVTHRNFLPNPVTRFCTQELKIRVMRDWMLARGYDHWTNVVGLRADEPGRVAKQRQSSYKHWDVQMPLADAGVTVEDVRAFWRCQPFDLGLRPWEGNCDLCFLKGRAKRERIMRDRPDLAAWWMEMEMEMRGVESPRAALFRADAPSYKDLFALSQRPMLPFASEDLDGVDDLGDCACELEAA